MVVYAAVALAVTVDTVRRDAGDARARPATGEEAAEQLIAAWERARNGTYVAVGTVERSSAVTGARWRSSEVLAQRPPRRLHRAHGGIEGRDDDRVLLCPATPGGGTGPCRLGPPGGPTYAESVAGELDALGDLLIGPARLYDTVAEGDGCFRLRQRRVEPRAPFGVGARFCFDGATGAVVQREVRHEGGITETLVVTEVRTEVGDADLEP